MSLNKFPKAFILQLKLYLVNKLAFKYYNICILGTTSKLGMYMYLYVTSYMYIVDLDTITHVKNNFVPFL